MNKEKNKKDPHNVVYSCKITKRQDEKIKFYEELGIIRSSFGTLGIEIVLQALDEIYKDYGLDPNKFKEKIKKPPILYQLDLLIKNLPPNEQALIKLFNDNHNRGERR